MRSAKRKRQQRRKEEPQQKRREVRRKVVAFDERAGELKRPLNLSHLIKLHEEDNTKDGPRCFMQILPLAMANGENLLMVCHIVIVWNAVVRAGSGKGLYLYSRSKAATVGISFGRMYLIPLEFGEDYLTPKNEDDKHYRVVRFSSFFGWCDSFRLQVALPVPESGAKPGPLWKFLDRCHIEHDSYQVVSLIV